MALDKVVDSAALDAQLTSIADAIRSKGGTTDQLTIAGMVDAINAIQTGSGGAGLAYDMGEFVLDADSAGLGEIYHNLGELPGFVLVWTDDYVGVTNPDTVYATSLGFVWMDQIMGLDNWFTSASSGKGTTVNFTQNKGSTGMSIVKPTSKSYAMGVSGSGNVALVTPEYFKLVKIAGKTFYRAGVTYKYFVSKAWWNIGGVASAE